MTELELDPNQRALNTARTLNSLLLMLSSVAMILWPWKSMGAVTSWQFALSAGTSLLSLLLIWSLKRLPTPISAMISFMSLCVIFSATFVTNLQLARSTLTYELFTGFKLAAVGLAVLVPFPEWIGFAAIIACGVLPVFEYHVFISSIDRQNIAVNEPFTTVGYAVIALGTLVHRIREISSQRKWIRAHEERNSIEKRAQMFLAVRDLSNTPLQIIELTTPLIRKAHPKAASLVDHLDYSASKLRELSEILASYDVETKWTEKNASLDAVGILRQ